MLFNTGKSSIYVFTESGSSKLKSKEILPLTCKGPSRHRPESGSWGAPISFSITLPLFSLHFEFLFLIHQACFVFDLEFGCPFSLECSLTQFLNYSCLCSKDSWKNAHRESPMNTFQQFCCTKINFSIDSVFSVELWKYPLICLLQLIYRFLQWETFSVGLTYFCISCEHWWQECHSRLSLPGCLYYEYSDK